MKIQHRLTNGQKISVTCQGLTVTGEIENVEIFSLPDGSYDLFALDIRDKTGSPHRWKPDIDGGSFKLLEQDIRAHLENHPITHHHPECGCFRCTYGDDAYIREKHPWEY